MGPALLLALSASLGQEEPQPWEDMPGAIVRPARRNLPPKPRPSPLPAPVPAPEPVPRAPRPQPRPPPPTTTTTVAPTPRGRGCVLDVKAVSRRTAEGLELQAVATNRSAVPLRLELDNPCPAPPVVFAGLPGEVDPFSLCNVGPCLAAPPITVVLQPGERRVLATGLLREAPTCGAPFRGRVRDVVPRLRYRPGVSGPLCGDAVPLPGLYQVEVPSPAPTVTPPPVRPRCPPMPDCAIGCPGSMPARSKDGCPVCGCEPIGPRLPRPLELPLE